MIAHSPAGLPKALFCLAFVGALALPPAPALASSHREAPAITETPKVDATDFYMFRSYEPGREAYVTLVANYLPLQDPYGGPNYFTLDPDGLYEIKVDNDGDAREDLSFAFRFQVQRRNFALEIGPDGAKKSVAIPFVQVGTVGAGDTDNLNVLETYTLSLVRRSGLSRTVQPVVHADTGERVFAKPVDRIGDKTIPDYEGYAREHIFPIRVPGCAGEGRVFVGQRKDPFVVNLGETFDLVNYGNPLGPRDAEPDSLADKNVTSLVLEVPIACLVSGAGPVIGAWTTASLPRERTVASARTSDPRTLALRSAAALADASFAGEAGFVQVSRLGMPLVNELVIGLEDKDRFNGSHPAGDAQFLDYVTHPTLPALIEILFGGAGVRAPTLFPRADLVAAFLTGVEGLNKTRTPAEMVRLNTSIPPVPAAQQKSLGVLEGDLAGFPNGRRPGDDVVDIELRVAMGALLPAGVAPSGSLPFTDGAYVDATFFDGGFPYLRTPLPGSPN